MKLPPEGSLLLRRHFTPKLQKAFAQLSGDYNPLHVDPVAARRTLVGAQAVHGIHQVMVAMEGLLSWQKKAGEQSPASLTGFTAQFQKPVEVGETVSFHAGKTSPDAARITGKIEEGTVCQIDLTFGNRAVAKTKPPALPIDKRVVELGLAELTDRKGKIALGLDARLARKLFPRLVEHLGPLAVAEMLALTRLVGMRCPGLHSLFSQASVRFIKAKGSSLAYRVIGIDDRFGRVRMEITGPSLVGELSVLFRPPPEPQPAMKEVRHVVAPKSFAQSTALIIGGSRGTRRGDGQDHRRGGRAIHHHLSSEARTDAETGCHGNIRAGGRSPANYLRTRYSRMGPVNLHPKTGIC